MSSNKCAKCELTVYPVESLRCLDKIWHKGCFKCHECNMTLNLKNYKGFEKRPYCNAHCPQAKATIVADTPEIRRLAENTRIQSQAKYHEEFEKSKGKGFTAIADDPETLRIMEASKIISNVAYHGELNKKKEMEEKRGLSGPEDLPILKSINNNNGKHQNNVPQKQDTDFASNHQSQTTSAQNHQQQMQRQLQQQQELQQQQQLHHQQQQHLLHKQQQQQQLQKQKQQQQMRFAQDHNGQQILIRQPQMIDPMQQQAAIKQLHHHQFPPGGQQHQLIMRQQQAQNHPQQQQHMMLQQHRQTSEPILPMSRQVPKQAVNHQHPPQHQPMMKPHMMPVQHQQPPPQMQHQMKFIPMSGGDAMMHPPSHLVGPQMMNQPPMGTMPNGQRVPLNQPIIAGPQGAHHIIRGPYNNQYQMSHMNGAVMPKQQQILNSQPRHLIHPNQIHQMNHPAHAGPHAQQQPQMQHHHPQQVPGRVFQAIYDYVANDVDEVSFFENDILIDCVNVDRNWLIGKVARSGETGMLPANYVAELPSQ